MTMRIAIGRTATALAAAALLVLALGVGAAVRAQQDDLAAQGKTLFEETAGGVGCAYCHGFDGRGAGTAGVEATDIVGADEARVRGALGGGVPMMDFIALNDAEIAAVVAHLAFLADPDAEGDPAAPAGDETPEAPPEAPAEPGDDADDGMGAAPERTVPFTTVNVALTETGFQPASIRIPVGQRIRLVVRNRTRIEHHYRVADMPVADLLWLAEPETEQRADVTDEEHVAHHASAWVAWRAPSPAGIQPSGDAVHAWAYLHSPGGGRDAVLFTPTRTGTFRVTCPLHPERVGEVVVY